MGCTQRSDRGTPGRVARIPAVDDLHPLGPNSPGTVTATRSRRKDAGAGGANPVVAGTARASRKTDCFALQGKLRVKS
jgi:hypothetical protein